MTMKAAGLLAGWKRRDAEHCLVVTMQIIEGGQSHDQREFGRLSLGISDDQLCSLARDLSRAASERGLVVWPTGKAAGAPSAVDRMLNRFMAPFSGKRPIKSRPTTVLLLQDLSA
jgi:hypothetical protein